MYQQISLTGTRFHVTQAAYSSKLHDSAKACSKRTAFNSRTCSWQFFFARSRNSFGCDAQVRGCARGDVCLLCVKHRTPFKVQHVRVFHRIFAPWTKKRELGTILAAWTLLSKTWWRLSELSMNYRIQPFVTDIGMSLCRLPRYCAFAV